MSAVHDPSLADHLAAKPPIRVLYTDLDGTLLGRGGSLLVDADGLPDTAAAAALVAAARADVAVVAVSGRRAATLAQDVRLMGLDGGIAEVGTIVIRDGQQHIRWGRCPRDLGPTPRAALQSVGALDVLLQAYELDLRTYAPWDADREGGYLLHGRIDARRATALLEEAGIGWAKLVDNGRTGGWEGRTDVHAYHLVAKGTGKAQALAEDLEERGVHRDEAIAVGDSVEDTTMAEVVGTYVVVADGHGTVGGNRFRSRGRSGEGVAEVIAAALAARAGRGVGT